jgi:hypothetical protein
MPGNYISRHKHIPNWNEIAQIHKYWMKATTSWLTLRTLFPFRQLMWKVLRTVIWFNIKEMLSKITESDTSIYQTYTTTLAKDATLLKRIRHTYSDSAKRILQLMSHWLKWPNLPLRKVTAWTVSYLITVQSSFTNSHSMDSAYLITVY